MNLYNISVFLLFTVQMTVGNVIKEIKSQVLPLFGNHIEGTRGMGNQISLRVFNGTDAEAYEFPYQVQITKDGSHDCGGTILNKNYILTAAHCFSDILDENYTQYQVIAGEYNIEVEEGTEQIRSIEKIIMHENYGYENRPYYNDIALLLLNHQLEFTSNVHPPLMPQPSFNATGLNAILTGWGDFAAHGAAPIVLQKANIPILSNQVCAKAYSKTHSYDFPETALCAGYPKGGKDACRGDSGGPLSIKLENGSYVVVGIVSYGSDGCVNPDLPGIYTKVSAYTGWIEAHAF